MTLRFPRTSLIVPTLVAAGFITAASQAHAQFGGLFQSVINSAVQQGSQQAATNAAVAAIGSQVSPQAAAAAGNLVPAQVNALGAAAAAIPQNDPEYQALMIQSLAQVPANQRSAVAPIIDMQVRQALASRRLGYAANTNTPYGLNAANTNNNPNNNPLANAAVQAALAQGLANNGGLNASALNGQAGQAAAAGALIQGLSSLFGSSAAPAQPTATNQP